MCFILTFMKMTFMMLRHRIFSVISWDDKIKIISIMERFWGFMHRLYFVVCELMLLIHTFNNFFFFYQSVEIKAWSVCLVLLEHGFKLQFKYNFTRKFLIKRHFNYMIEPLTHSLTRSLTHWLFYRVFNEKCKSKDKKKCFGLIGKAVIGLTFYSEAHQGLDLQIWA